MITAYYTLCKKSCNKLNFNALPAILHSVMHSVYFVKIDNRTGGITIDTEHSIMSDAAKEAQRKYKREYMRKWRAENKEKVAANNRKYWERRAERETVNNA